MTPKHKHYCIQKILSAFMLIGLPALCSASALGQLPDQEQGAEPVAVRPRLAAKPAVVAKNAEVAPVVQQGLTPPVYNDPAAALRSAKMIYVKSTSLLVRPPAIEEKLQSRREFTQLGLVITRDLNEADLILIVAHDLFTKYVYTVMHKDTDIIVASGKVSSLGGTVAGKVAKRFLKRIEKARATAPRSTS